MQWKYNLNEAIRLKYTVDVDQTNPSYHNNFVKSIRMSPTGYSYIYSSEDGIVRYVDLSTIDFWGVNEDVTDSCEKSSGPAPLSPICNFNHTEIVYGMDW